MEVDDLLREFQRVLDVDWWPASELLNSAREAVAGCSGSRVLDAGSRRRHLLALVNSKLGVNEKRFHAFLDRAAARRVFLNYHEMAQVLAYLDTCDMSGFLRWAEGRDLAGDLCDLEGAASRETLDALREQLRTGHVVRKDARQCGAAIRRDEVLRGLFGSFVFCCFPVAAMHCHFNEDCRREYLPDFYDHLVRFHRDVLQREYALVFLIVDDEATVRFAGDRLRDAVCGFVKEAYDRLGAVSERVGSWV